MGTTLV